MKLLPDELTGPFTRAEAYRAGVTPRMLRGKRFVRVHPGVWARRDRPLDFEGRLAAARLALPGSARTTGGTRLRQLGLDLGSDGRLHYVLEGDHHLAIPGIFLHRTKVMPPADDDGVRPVAAFVAYCATARMLDAVAVGDWLLHRKHMTLPELETFLGDQPWRRGAAETALVISHLRVGSRSIRESNTRVMVVCAGLPEPQCNAPVRVADDLTVLVDLWFVQWTSAVEYEGEQHQQDRGQYVSDIDRYKQYRRAGIGYRQITKELMRSPRSVVRSIHELLVEGGYDGPPPIFGDTWEQLFMRLGQLVPRRRAVVRARAVS